MNPTHLAQSAYGGTESPIKTERGTEYTVFERVTARLVQADKPGASIVDRAGALHQNRQLWTLLAVDVANEENALPQALRARIFYLGEFTQAHSRKVLSGEAGMTPLIEINRAVMRGLLGKAEAA